MRDQQYKKQIPTVRQTVQEQGKPVDDWNTLRFSGSVQTISAEATSAKIVVNRTKHSIGAPMPSHA